VTAHRADLESLARFRAEVYPEESDDVRLARGFLLAVKALRGVWLYAIVDHKGQDDQAAIAAKALSRIGGDV
jgi:hypothetical protein